MSILITRENRASRVEAELATRFETTDTHTHAHMHGFLGETHRAETTRYE